MNRGMQTIDVERSPCILDHRTKRKVQIWIDTEESPLEAAMACQSTLWLIQQHKKATLCGSAEGRDPNAES